MSPIELFNKNFNLMQICRSGQCFRFEHLGGSDFCVVANGFMLRLQQTDKGILFFCGEDEYKAVWHHYFDLQTDYSAYIASIGDADPIVATAADFGSGIRILRQDLWEMIISFIISQQSNIPRIKKNIETISARFGKRLTHSDMEYYDFPTPSALYAAGTDALRECMLGYRADYIYHTSKSVCEGEIDLEALKKMPYSDAKKALLTLKGVGDKVADCICLFGLHHLDAFPKDTHINRIFKRDYPKGFDYNAHLGYNGLIQQYLFYHDLWSHDKRQK